MISSADFSIKLCICTASGDSRSSTFSDRKAVSKFERIIENVLISQLSFELIALICPFQETETAALTLTDHKMETLGSLEGVQRSFELSNQQNNRQEIGDNYDQGKHFMFRFRLASFFELRNEALILSSDSSRPTDRLS